MIKSIDGSGRPEKSH